MLNHPLLQRLPAPIRSRLQNRGVMGFIFALLPLLVAGVFAWILIKNWDQILAFPWQINLKYLFLVWFFHSLAVWFTFVAWQLMISRLGGYHDWVGGFRLYYLSLLTRRLPTSLPNIGGRIVMYRPFGVSAAVVMNCILLETLLVGLGGVLVFLIFLPFYTSVTPGVALPLFSVGVGLLMALIVRPQIFIDVTNWALLRLHKNPLALAPARRDILLWVGVYMLPWLLSGFAFYYLPRAVSPLHGPGWFDALGISSLSTLISLLSLVLPGGLGLKEITSTGLLTPWMPISTALIISIFYRLLQTANDIVWALGVLLIPGLQKAPDEAPKGN